MSDHPAIPLAYGGYEMAADFSGIVTPSGEFSFTTNQRRAVEALWRAGPRGLSSAAILEIIESRSLDLRSVFRPGGKLSPAWGRVIVSSSRGVYRLAIPAELFSEKSCRTGFRTGMRQDRPATISA